MNDVSHIKTERHADWALRMMDEGCSTQINYGSIIITAALRRLPYEYRNNKDRTLVYVIPGAKAVHP